MSPRTTAPCRFPPSLQGDRRLGALDPASDHDRDLIEGLGIGVYDISDLASNLIGHDNYANAPQVVRQIGKRRAPRRRHDQAVIDAGADRTPRPPPGQITTGHLPAPERPPRPPGRPRRGKSEFSSFRRVGEEPKLFGCWQCPPVADCVEKLCCCGPVWLVIHFPC